MTNTMAVVMKVSRRVGQVTLSASARTSCRNLNGLILAMGLSVGSNRHDGPNLEGLRPSTRSFLGAGSPRKSVTGPQAMAALLERRGPVVKAKPGPLFPSMGYGGSF